MERLQIRPFRPADRPVMAELLAMRHRRDRARLPMLAAALETTAGCEALLGPLVHRGRLSGAIAERGGRPVGFLTGERMLLDPESFSSRWIPPHSVSIAIEGHAIADGEDATEVYRALYGHLAANWVGQGFFIQRVAITAGDLEAQEAWVSLGFGRCETAAVRSVGPVDGEADAGIAIHRAADEDLDVISDLADQLGRFHASSPMFWPSPPETDAAARLFDLQELTSQATPYFVAYREGAPVGMQTFLRPGFTPPIVDQSANVYLCYGVVSAAARGTGAGTALLRHAMSWAAEAGYQTCTLHFASANPSGGPFWLGHGFVPVEHTMERRIDERIAWAHGRG